MILTTNLSYGESTCLGVGVVESGADGGGSVSADFVARHLTFVEFLVSPKACLLARARLPNAVHKDDIFGDYREKGRHRFL